MNFYSCVRRFWIMLFSVCVYGDIIREDNFFEAEFSNSHKGRMLRVLMSFNNIGLELCVVKCIQHISCKTVNYHFEKVKCELTDVDFNEDESDKISHGWYNYGTQPKVNGQWGSWREVTRCSATCGGGTMNQARDCDSPQPQHGGDDCVGKGERTIECNKHPCPVDGQWGSWREVTNCSATCEGGTTVQRRDCDSPKPAHGGNDCDGKGEKTIKCNTHPCPVDGHWGKWSSWSQCSTKCGKGDQKRSRLCNKPSPAKGGRPCSGKSGEVQTCDMGSCNGQVFEHECKWVPGGNGKQATCPHRYIATGACGSGSFSDCDHNGESCTTKLKCCRTSAAVTNYCSLERSRESGVEIACPSQRVVTSFCGSERVRKCWEGYWTYYFTNCCAMKDHRPGFERDCYWRFETYGKDLECGKNMIMTGMCGVGRRTTKRCPGNTHHGIKCCTFSKGK